MDEDGNGTIDQNEWLTTMKTMGIDKMDREIIAVFKMIDVDNSGEIGFNELRR